MLESRGRKSTRNTLQTTTGAIEMEKGVHHAVISSGVVIVEKDGREPPLDA
jgi:hypothetical protein